jgi:hypothetical protein
MIFVGEGKFKPKKGAGGLVMVGLVPCKRGRIRIFRD